jgi:hypothetical protein
VPVVGATAGPVTATGAATENVSRLVTPSTVAPSSVWPAASGVTVPSVSTEAIVGARVAHCTCRPVISRLAAS